MSADKSSSPWRRSTKVALVVAVLLLGGLSVAVATVAVDQSSSAGGVLRSYYIAANEVEWNYTPSGMDEVSGTPFGTTDPGQLLFTQRTGTYLGESFLKCVYQQYTDASFSTLVPQPPWEGIMGPTLYAEVGDTIQVDFQNHCRFPESIHPHGVFYNRTFEGAPYNNSGPPGEGGDVPPGGNFTYEWYVPERAGPGPLDGTAVMWMYHSHVYEPIDVNEGLIGSIIISAPGQANPDGTPKGFGMVVSLLADIFYEDQSDYELYNIQHDEPNATAMNQSGILSCLGLGSDQSCNADPNWSNWSTSMEKFTINGYSYGNLPMITIPEGTRVLWCMMGMGEDYHALAFDGNDLLVDGMREDVVPLTPAVMTDGIMYANNTGTFLLESVIPTDLDGGMTARYTVVPSGSADASSSTAGTISTDLLSHLGPHGAPSMTVPAQLPLWIPGGAAVVLPARIAPPPLPFRL